MLITLVYGFALVVWHYDGSFESIKLDYQSTEVDNGILRRNLSEVLLRRGSPRSTSSPLHLDDNKFQDLSTLLMRLALSLVI